MEEWKPKTKTQELIEEVNLAFINHPHYKLKELNIVSLPVGRDLAESELKELRREFKSVYKSPLSGYYTFIKK